LQDQFPLLRLPFMELLSCYKDINIPIQQLDVDE
jgi:hypothetical protein